MARISPGGITEGHRGGLGIRQRRVGWQPSRFLADQGEPERTYALAERLGRINAVVQELGTTWPSLRKHFSGTV